MFIGRQWRQIDCLWQYREYVSWQDFEVQSGGSFLWLLLLTFIIAEHLDCKICSVFASSDSLGAALCLYWTLTSVTKGRVFKYCIYHCCFCVKCFLNCSLPFTNHCQAFTRFFPSQIFWVYLGMFFQHSRSPLISGTKAWNHTLKASKQTKKANIHKINFYTSYWVYLHILNSFFLNDCLNASFAYITHTVSGRVQPCSRCEGILVLWGLQEYS